MGEAKPDEEEIFAKWNQRASNKPEEGDLSRSAKTNRTRYSFRYSARASIR
jgi:hypothetical protein